MLQSLILIDALSSADWEKKKRKIKKKRETAGGLFSQAGHILLAVPWDFCGC
jgi:hypothetical protein